MGTGGTASDPVFGRASWAGPPSELDTGVPASARMYNYWLGGKDNFAVDRAVAEQVVAAVPAVREMAWENRRFVGRAARFVAGAGVDQFLDIGTGIPISPNLHETVQEVMPSTRVVYVDNDPVVLAHARAFAESVDSAPVVFVDADLRDPRALLAAPRVSRALDLTRPIGLSLIAVLMLLSDDDDPWQVLDTLRDALPSGSYLALTHPGSDFDPAAMGAVVAVAERVGATFRPRSRSEVSRFFGDWELVEPGVVPVSSWRPDGTAGEAFYWAGVARKP